MSVWPFRSRTVWIVPLVLLVVALFQEVMTYKVRQHVRDIYARAAVILVLDAFAFGFAAAWLSPWIRGLLGHSRKRANRMGGTIGLLVFYALAYGALFYAYVIVERSGPGGLLPRSLR